MSSFDWVLATARTGQAILWGVSLGTLLHALVRIGQRLAAGEHTRWVLLEFLGAIVAVLVLWWLAALCRAVANARTERPERIPSRSPVTRRIVTVKTATR